MWKSSDCRANPHLKWGRLRVCWAASPTKLIQSNFPRSVTKRIWAQREWSHFLIGWFFLDVRCHCFGWQPDVLSRFLATACYDLNAVCFLLAVLRLLVKCSWFMFEGLFARRVQLTWNNKLAVFEKMIALLVRVSCSSCCRCTLQLRAPRYL